MTDDQLWAEFKQRYPKQIKGDTFLYTVDELIAYWSKRDDPKSKRILAYWKNQK